MAKPAHSRIVFEGVMGSVAAPLERWAFGLNFPHEALSVGSTQLTDDGLASDAMGAWSTRMAQASTTDCLLTQVKVSSIDAAGLVEHRADGSYAQGVWTGSVAGLNAPRPVPLQTALVVSLVTARSGPTGKGRFFLPWPSYDLGADKRLAVSDVEDLIEFCIVPFLQDLETLMTFPAQVVSSKGYMSAVTGVRVGRAPDTLRSRREDSPEGYLTASF